MFPSWYFKSWLLLWGLWLILSLFLYTAWGKGLGSFAHKCLAATTPFVEGAIFSSFHCLDAFV
jgi:hypothetical protein